MNLPDDLNRLPPQALDVIRYLGVQPQGSASIYAIMDDLGMSERGLRKWLRRLVTRYYAEMPYESVYRLTAHGLQAADTLRAFDAAHPEAARAARSAMTDTDDASLDDAPLDDAPLSGAEVAASAADPGVAGPPSQPEQRQHRRLMVRAPKALIATGTATLLAGLERPASDQPDQSGIARVIVRVSAPGCDVRPTERPLDVPPGRLAGPVSFQLVPRRPGVVRVKVAVFQLVTRRDLLPVGGMFFDLVAADFPTPESVEMQALAADVELWAS